MSNRQNINGISKKILEVDLSNESFNIFTVPDIDIKMYLGGKGLGLKMIYDRMKPGIDPLGEENIIAFMTGAFLGTGVSCSSRFNAITKSISTGLMAASSCGGPFGEDLKTAGWDGILIKGKSKNPVFLKVTADGVKFEDAKDLWGKDTVETQEMLEKKAGKLVIGQAGENLVRVASIASGHRFLGRGGMGAVMGSKNLKAIVAIGKKYKIVPKDQQSFKNLKAKALKYINNNQFTNAYKEYGVPSHYQYADKYGSLPVNNFTKGRHKDGATISGESIKTKYKTSHSTCKHCTILCGKKGIFDGKEKRVPEWETLALLGSNLGIFDPAIIARWNELCGQYGMDTISVGNIIGWAMEATEKGIVKSNLKFGTPEGVDEIIRDIGMAKGLGKEMALGVKALSEKYGGKEFAMQVKGLEVPGYDPRGAFGQGLAYAVANRGACHLSAALLFFENNTGLLNPETTKAKATFVKFFETVFNSVNSTSICLFTVAAFTLESPLSKYSPNIMLHLLMQHLPRVAVNLIDTSLYPKLWSAITGIDLSNAEFMKIGDRIHVLERYMNTLEGISKKDDVLPERFLKEGRESDPQKVTVSLEPMLEEYYKLRGFNKNGIPTSKTLSELNIAER
ncbi:MAG: aldehyde ferredoxin oxidoreductase family protein [Bacteroidetes bacterium]|nr:aldehyde ferredoxin oxidoreductase family protein [Bacteroidota bacterium]